MEYIEVIFWSAVGSVFSLIGGLMIIGNKRLRVSAMRYGLPFGAGALLAAAFLAVLPEAIEGSTIKQALAYALGGFLVFFMLERTLDWFHHHEPRRHGDVDDTASKSHQWLVIIGDTLHNAVDGVAIGAAFLINPAAGIGTALAVAAHEIPQEIGDFGILLGKGMRPRSVIVVSLLSGLATVATAILTYAIGSSYDINPAPLLAAAGGFFIYIAASDIIPEIHDLPRREGNRQALLLLLGVAILAVVLALMPHNHDHGSSHQADHSHHGDHEHNHDRAEPDCLSQETLNAMGAPPPGYDLPPACK